MAFGESIKRFVTGKTEAERKQEAAAESIIRQRALAAALKERQTQRIRIAQERERLIANSQVKKIRDKYNPPKRSNQPNSFGNFFGDQIGINKSKKLKPQRKFDVLGI